MRRVISDLLPLAPFAVLLGCLGYLKLRAVRAVRQAIQLQMELRQLSQNELVEPGARRHLAMLASDHPGTMSLADLVYWMWCARWAIIRAKRAMFATWNSWVDGLGPTTA